MRELSIHVQTLISKLEREGISFKFDDSTQLVKTNNGIINNVDEYVEKRLENVVFERNGFAYKIYEGQFFREFGQSHHFVKKENDYELSVLSDSDFYGGMFNRILSTFKKRNV